jgi:hypothetical protein
VLWARELTRPALVAKIQGGRLHWVDRGGSAHVADATTGALLASRELGLELEVAAPAGDGFLLQTPAGEVGFAQIEPVPAEAVLPAAREEGADPARSRQESDPLGPPSP